MDESKAFKWENKNTVVISGDIDEFFPYVELFSSFEPDTLVRVDLSGVSRMNSCGVREWLRGLMGNRSQIEYVHCPGFFIEQINLVTQLMPPGTKVASFECSFICDDCDEETKTICFVGKDYHAGQEVTEPPGDRTCLNCGGLSGFSHNAETFFIFLMNLPQA